MIFRPVQEEVALQVSMTNFGASFKNARESEGISLEEIAAETRICTRFLTAIENEEFHLLPGGIFNRGFVRAYAEKLGLDPDQAVADYSLLTGVRQPSEAFEAERVAPSKHGHLYLIPAGALIMLIAMFYLLTRQSSQNAQTANPLQPAISSRAAQTTSAALDPEAVPPRVEGLTIEMQTRDPAWIKVKADGDTVNRGETLQPGMTRKFTAQTSIQVIVGNAGGLMLKINDQLAKPVGKSGQVREFTITSDNLKDFIE